jgi:hypothetical protein
MIYRIAAFLTCVMLLGGCTFPAGCGSTVLSEAKSPDGNLKAVVFNYDCGATTGTGTHVSLLPASVTSPNDAGNVFVADGNGGPAVSVKWLSANRLLVSYDKTARTFGMEKQFNSVTISYKTF